MFKICFRVKFKDKYQIILWYNKISRRCRYLSLVNDYLKNQLKRLDTLFQSTPEAKQACVDLNHSFKDSKNQIIELYRQIEAFETDFNDAEIRNIKDMHQKWQDKEKVTKQSIYFSEQQYLDSKKEITHRGKNNSHTIEQELRELFKKRQDYLNNTAKDIEYLEKTLTKENNALILEEEGYHETYLNKISKLHEEKTANRNRINHTYIETIKDIHKRNEGRLDESKIVENELTKEFNEYTEFHKNDLIYIRQNFHRIQEQLNTKINEVDQNYRKLFQNTDRELVGRQKTIDAILANMHGENIQKTRDINSLLEHKLTKIDTRIDHLRQKYDANLKKLINHFKKDVTDINKKHLFQKQTLLETKENIKEKHQLIFKEIANSNGSIKAAEKNYDKELNGVNKDINRINIETEKLIMERKFRFYRDRLSLGYEFIRNQEIFRYYKYIQDKRKNNRLNKNKLTFIRYEMYMNKLHTLFHQEKNKKNRIIELGIKDELLPVDIQILLARHIHDLEINYLNLEQNYTKANYERLIRLEKLETGYAEFVLRREKERIDLINNYENKQNEIDLYLFMEYEKNTLEGHRQVLNAKKGVNTAKNQIEVLYKEHEKEIYLEKHNSEVERIRSYLKIQNERLLLEDAYQHEIHKFEKEKLTRELQKEVSVLQANEIINTSVIENTRFQKVLSNYFLMLQALHTELERIISTLKDAFLSAFNHETFIKITNTIKEIILAEKNYKDSLLEEITDDTKAKIEAKIDELTSLKYEKEHAKLLDDYEIEKNQIHEERIKLNDEIKSLRSESLELYNEIAKLENNNATIKKTIDFSLAQIKALQLDKNRQSKKTAKNLNMTISSFRKDISKNKDEINHLKLKIAKIKTNILQINKGFKPLDDLLINLERNREIKLAQLGENKYIEGKVYYENLNSLELVKNEFLEENKNFTITVNNLLETVEKENLKEREFNRVFNKLSKHVDYQRKINKEMHKRLSKLLDKQHFTVRDEQRDIINGFNKSYQVSVENLVKVHKQELKKIGKGNEELSKYQKSLTTIAKDKYRKTIDIYREKHRRELKNAHLNHQKEILNKENTEYTVNNFLKATSLNKQQVLLSNEINMKTDLREFDLSRTTISKEKQREILELNTTIAEADETYQKRLLYFANVDKRKREHLNKTLSTRKKRNTEEINSLNREIAKTEQKAKRNERITNRKIARIERKAQKREFRMVKFEKFKLYFAIKKMRIEFKTSLKKEENIH